MESTRYSCLILETLKFSRQIFDKYPDIKFHENPSIGSRIVPCGQRRTGGQTGLPKPMVDFRNFANAPTDRIKVRQRTSSLHRGEQMNKNYCLLCILSVRNLNTFQPLSWQRTCRSSGGENLTYHSGDSGSIPDEFAWDFSAIFSVFFGIIIVRPLLLGFWYEGYISGRH
jgi:hypothetical protein